MWRQRCRQTVKVATNLEQVCQFVSREFFFPLRKWSLAMGTIAQNVPLITTTDGQVVAILFRSYLDQVRKSARGPSPNRRRAALQGGKAANPSSPPPIDHRQEAQSKGFLLTAWFLFRFQPREAGQCVRSALIKGTQGRSSTLECVMIERGVLTHDHYARRGGGVSACIGIFLPTAAENKANLC